VVCSFTLSDVTDAIELRGVLEGTAARFAAERLESPSELAELVAVTVELDRVVAERGPALERYVELNDEYHAVLVTLAKSDSLARAIANAVALPFASAGALLASQATLSREHEILVVAQHQHRMLLESVRAGHGARAEEIAREHARLAKLNLELVLESEHALERLPGAPLLRGVI
jgi:GntR family transcriptional regulator, vanillate catabolism transcriptional regulator